jgi:hypothetical protein
MTTPLRFNDSLTGDDRDPEIRTAALSRDFP